MAKKITLKHIVDGTVYTRTTARTYTHVVLAKTDVAATVAAMEAGRSAKIQGRKVWANGKWDKEMYNNTHDVGHVSYMGYYIVTQTDRDEAREFFEQHGHLTREQYALIESIDCGLKLDEQIKKLRESTPTWDVAAWSGSRELAMKACSQFERYHNFTRVEAINNGVAA